MTLNCRCTPISANAVPAVSISLLIQLFVCTVRARMRRATAEYLTLSSIKTGNPGYGVTTTVTGPVRDGGQTYD